MKKSAPITPAAPIESVDATLQARGARYGSLTVNGSVAQKLKQTFRESPNWNTLGEDQKEALDIIASKIARALTGDSDYADNWHDIAGYARLVDNRLNNRAA